MEEEIEQTSLLEEANIKACDQGPSKNKENNIKFTIMSDNCNDKKANRPPILVDTFIKTFDNRDQNKLELDIGLFSISGSESELSNSKSKPSLVIQKKNIIQQESKMSSHLDIPKNEFQQISSLFPPRHHKSSLALNQYVKPMKLKLEINQGNRKVTPIVAVRTNPLKNESLKLKRKASHNDYRYEESKYFTSNHEYSIANKSYNSTSKKKSMQFGNNYQNIELVLPPLVKRDLQVNASWNNLLNRNLGIPETPNCL